MFDILMEPRFRHVFASAAGGVWIFLVIWIATDQLRLHPGDPTAANWAPLFLAIAGLLFGAQLCFQVLARQLDYLSLLWSVVLFVQAATIETALLVVLAGGESDVRPWVFPVMSTAVVLLLVIVLAQVLILRWARDLTHRELEKIIVKKSTLSPEDCHKLIAAAKYIIPLDFHPEAPLSSTAMYPDAWEDLKGVLSLHKITLTDDDLSSVRGVTNQNSKLIGAQVSYWYTGFIAGLLGSLAVVFGAAAI